MHPVGTPGQAKGLPHVGQILGGKYEIVRLLGEGGMAFVFEANHQRLHQRVAIKVLAPELARDPELVARFEREARAVAGLRTKHVVRVMDVDTTPGGIAYIVMEFLEGRDLDAELRARTRLPASEAVNYLLQVCAGMVEAHANGIIHRDLKPANLFLTQEHEADDRLVKVLDFGISKMIGEATRLTAFGAVMGTVLYMSPEQVRALPEVDTRADIWALGVILYELIAGRAPWEGHSAQIAAAIVSQDPPDLRAFAPVPDGVAEAVRTMLQREPAHRFANVRDVLAALAPHAPAGSVGASVAEQVLSQGAGRGRASLPAGGIMKQTLPMISRPSLTPPPAPAHARPLSPATPPLTPAAGAQTAPGPVSIAPLSAGSRSRARLALIFAILIGLVGAAGVVLILLATLHRPSPPKPTADDAAPQPKVGAPTSATASAAEAATATPPSTGTGRASSTAPSAEPTSSRPAASAVPGPSAKKPPASKPGSSGPAAGSASSGLPSFL